MKSIVLSTATVMLATAAYILVGVALASVS